MYWKCIVYVTGMYHGCIMILRVYWWCIRCVLVMYWIIMPLVKRRVKRRVQVPGCKSLRSPWGDISGVVYFTCIANVSRMYPTCIMTVISMYLSCIMDVLEVAPHTSVFLHTLPITFLGPSLSGYPVLGISSLWVWLLLDGGSLGMAAPGMLFGRQGMHVPACPVGCYSAETTAGQASTRGPCTPCSRPEPLGCSGGPNRAQKTVKSTS